MFEWAHKDYSAPLPPEIQKSYTLLGFLLVDQSIKAREGFLAQASLLAMLLATALSVQRNRSVMQRDINIAQHVQRKLLPENQPFVPGIDYHVIFSAARGVTGDFYGYSSPGPEHLNFVLGDVSGKGVGAALLMASIVPGIRGIMSEQISVEETMARFHAHIFDASPPGSYATMFFASFDLQRSQIRFVNAGHQPFPFLIRAGGRGVSEFGSSGSVLGLFERPRKAFKVGRATLQSGDVIICATDGATDAESPSGEMFEEARLRLIAKEIVGTTKAPKAVASELYAAILDHSSGTPQTDDIAIAVFTIR